MRITELLDRMGLEITYRQIGRDLLPQGIAVLTGDCLEDPNEEVIAVLTAQEAAAWLRRPAARERWVFCCGAAPQDGAIPEGDTLVCFNARPGRIALAAQRALRQPKADHESLLGRLVEGRVRGDENATELLRGLGLPVNGRFQVLLVSFLGRMEEIPWDTAARQLSGILGGDPVYLYRGDLLALHPLPGELPLEPLQQYLEEQGAFAAVSNSALRPMALQVLYRQARAAMRFGLALRLEAPSRVLYYQRYFFLQVVENCAGANQSAENLLYLCHPSLGKVLRYDRTHNTNFSQILRKFLENNLVMSQTAKDLYMHRNTLLHKLEHLQELLGVPLSDPLVREQLQFSFHVVDYVELYLHGKTF